VKGFFDPRWGFFLLLALAVFGVSGCASTESDVDNVSARPWNAPKTWENGLPSSMTEGH